MDVTIPHRIIRSVPKHTTDEVEGFWDRAAELHKGWEMVTYRDPISPEFFPITSPYWDRCQSGAQLAGLVRLEALWDRGGLWLDSDCEVYRAFTPLMDCKAFAGWEDTNTVPDAVMGAEQHHPAIKDCLNLAIERIQSDSEDWTTGRGAWSTGPGVTTTIFPGRGDVLLLPPQSFFAVHYSEKEKLATHQPGPYEFCSHRWAGSWLAST